ncbi:MAG: GlsB/YeaQ/YmgE family stress response membrane protein [Anaerolineales bacterium]
MSIVGFLLLLLVAAIAGSLGQALVGFSRGGCLVSIAVGFVGAWLGWWLARQFNLPAFFVVNIEGEPFPVVWAIIGSAIFAAILSLFFRGRRVRYYR